LHMRCNAKKGGGEVQNDCNGEGCGTRCGTLGISTSTIYQSVYGSNSQVVIITKGTSFGQGEIYTMMKQSQDVLAWYDNMRNPVPTWYLIFAKGAKNV
jgi:hypothetical protein